MRNGINRSSDKGFWSWCWKYLKGIPTNKRFIGSILIMGGLFLVGGSTILVALGNTPILLICTPIGAIMFVYGIYLSRW